MSNNQISVNFSTPGNVTGLTSALGDLIVGDSTGLTSLSVGADGQVLTADSGQPSGLSWAAASGGGTITRQEFLTSGNLNLPSGVTNIWVFLQGGGGGGAGAAGGTGGGAAPGAGGGAGGETVWGVYTVPDGDNLSIAVGGGGTGGAGVGSVTNGNPGTNGGDSIIETSGAVEVVRARGGLAGETTTSSTAVKAGDGGGGMWGGGGGAHWNGTDQTLQGLGGLGTVQTGIDGFKSSAGGTPLTGGNGATYIVGFAEFAGQGGTSSIGTNDSAGGGGGAPAYFAIDPTGTKAGDGGSEAAGDFANLDGEDSTLLGGGGGGGASQDANPGGAGGDGGDGYVVIAYVA